MIQIIAGGKGSGKTKRLISIANDEVHKVQGHVVFIDHNNRSMYDLEHDIRLIDMEDYPVKTPNEFFGFLCGMISNDYDIEKIYIDGLFKIGELHADDLVAFLPRLDELAKKYSFDVVFTVSGEESILPDTVKPYIVK